MTNYSQSQLRNSAELEIGENFRIYPSGITQTEVFIESSVSDPFLLFATANTITFQPSFFVSEGIYLSTDGGINWQGSDTCKGEFIQFHGGDPGIVIDKNGRFILTRLGRQPFAGLYSHFSDDNGRTWSNQRTISTDDLERATITTDAAQSSNYYGRTYAAWVRFAPPYPVMLSYTDNGSISWSEPAQLNNPVLRCAGGDAATGPTGEIYVCWAAVEDISPFTEISVGFASSVDGGNSWNIQENAIDINGIKGILPQKQNIRVDGNPRIGVDRSGGERDGWIYIVTNQKNLAPAGSDPDIIIYRSTNKGGSWSAPVRVNQDAINNGKTQYFPSVEIDGQGAVNILYYDDRLTSADSTGVFLSRSVDGGESFTDYEISDHNFQPLPIGGLGQGYQGDNIDISSSAGRLIPVWMDNSTGIYQIWSAIIELPTSGIVTPNLLENDFHLSQNYPNPFNDGTIIEFETNSASRISLKIFDSKGELINTLFEGNIYPGVHKIAFDASEFHLSSGVYFYKLESGGRVHTKSMIYLK